MQLNTHSVLVRIVDDLGRYCIRSPEDAHAALKKYPAAVLRCCTEDTTDPNWVGVWYQVFDEFLLHSAHQPALRRSTYYLLGHRLTQEMWFDILEYTEEEQVAHCLQWGRNV